MYKDMFSIKMVYKSVKKACHFHALDIILHLSSFNATILYKEIFLVLLWCVADFPMPRFSRNIMNVHIMQYNQMAVDHLHMLTCIEFWAVDCTYHRIQLPAWIKRETRDQTSVISVTDTDDVKSWLTESDKAVNWRILIVQNKRPRDHFVCLRLHLTSLFILKHTELHIDSVLNHFITSCSICFWTSHGGGNNSETDGKESRLNILQTSFALIECSHFHITVYEV